MAIFSILDENNYITHSVSAEVCPENGTPLLVTERMRKPRLVEGVIIDEEPYTPEEVLEELKHDEYQNYLKRQNDGKEAYLKMSADLRALKLSGAITEEGHSVVDSLLEPIGDSVFRGQWIDARRKLIELTDAVIGVDLYSYILANLDAYIEANY